MSFLIYLQEQSDIAMPETKKRLNPLIPVIGLFALSGCMTFKASVDPRYHHATYETIRRPADPIPAKVEVQVHVNGKHRPKNDANARGTVERTLRASGVFIPTTDENAPVTITVIANERLGIADIGETLAKAYIMGLTWGIVGSNKDCKYDFTFSYQDATNREHQFACNHSMNLALGNTRAPDGHTSTTPVDAFETILEDATLSFVKELQDSGLPTQ